MLNYQRVNNWSVGKKNWRTLLDGHIYVYFSGESSSSCDRVAWEDFSESPMNFVGKSLDSDVSIH